MKRFAAVLAGTAALAALTGVQTASANPVGVTTCGTPGVPNHVTVRACININQGHVYAFGRATPYSATWQDQQVSFQLTTIGITNPALGTVYPTVLIEANGPAQEIGSVTGDVPCGSQVTATFTVTQPGWYPSSSTVSTVVNYC
ncbi:hypothetical protein ABTX81_33740 [Kitasatospora sp. NPDC097605]|uniref:hypothetical protein n=1 Tax=Kitasatospora sp. NPDC097605 TaxID=3157226 RepID=UPI00332117D9